MQTIKEKDTLALLESGLNGAQTYDEYRKLVAQLALDRATTGPEQKESLIDYTVLNDRRMSRWDKTLKISEEAEQKIKKLDRKVLWVVLTESWCGDASPSLPVMNKMAQLSDNLELKIILRDENVELMSRFLTDGAMSIPKLITVDQDAEKIIGTWGPRPSIATRMAEDYKKERGSLTPEFKEHLQVWYNKNKGQNILEDLSGLLTLK